MSVDGTTPVSRERSRHAPRLFWRTGGVVADTEPRVEQPIGLKGYAALLALFAALVVIFATGPIAHSLVGKRNKDYTLWYHTGRIMLAGGDVYPRDQRLFPFMYPPSCAALLAIGSAAGEVPLVVGLTLLNSAAWIASIVLAVYLATGRSLRQDWRLYLTPTLCVLPFVHDTYLLGQPNLLLLALMLGAFACLRLGKESSSGALIALAAGIKAFPILAVGYLAYRRRWRAVAASGIALVVLLLVLPSAFRGPVRAVEDLAIWTRGMVLKYDADGIAQRPQRCYSFKNQSLMAIGNRLLRAIPADGEADLNWKVNVTDLDFRTVNAVIIASGLALCGFSLWSMSGAGRRPARSDAIEGAMILLLILAFSPLSFNYFFVWLLYPLTVALQLTLAAPRGSSERARSVAWLAAVVTLLALAIPFLRGAGAYGNLFFASVVLLIGLGRALRRPAVAVMPA